MQKRKMKDIGYTSITYKIGLSLVIKSDEQFYRFIFYLLF